MSDEGRPAVFSTVHGWMDGTRLQAVIGRHKQPGVIFLFGETWHESVTISQHNLTLVAQEGDATKIQSDGDQPAISILEPNVRLLNLSVSAPKADAAIEFAHADATQAHLTNVTIENSGGHGIYRDSVYNSALMTVQNSTLRDIDGHGIFAESGSGPQNVLYNNTGEAIGGDFLYWGVDASILFNNHCEDAPIRLTEKSRYNFLLNHPDQTEIIDEGENNQDVNKINN